MSADERTVESLKPWELFIAFLEAVGVDKMSAIAADVHISAGVNSGQVEVTEYERDAEGALVRRGDEFATTLRKLPFTRIP